MFISQEVRRLGKDMVLHFNMWTQYDNYFHNKKIKIWTSNGVFFIDTYPNIDAFNIFEKFYLHKCIKISNIKKAID